MNRASALRRREITEGIFLKYRMATNLQDLKTAIRTAFMIFSLQRGRKCLKEHESGSINVQHAYIYPVMSLQRDFVATLCMRMLQEKYRTV
jgi:hypothetical protein